MFRWSNGILLESAAACTHRFLLAKSFGLPVTPVVTFFRLCILYRRLFRVIDNLNKNNLRRQRFHALCFVGGTPIFAPIPFDTSTVKILQIECEIVQCSMKPLRNRFENPNDSSFCWYRSIRRILVREGRRVNNNE